MRARTKFANLEGTRDNKIGKEATKNCKKSSQAASSSTTTTTKKKRFPALFSCLLSRFNRYARVCALMTDDKLLPLPFQLCLIIT